MIPAELKKLKKWMYCEPKNNAPADSTGKIVSYLDEKNYFTYAELQKNKEHIFVLKSDYVCIDFDSCLDSEGNIIDWAKEFVEPFLDNGFYVEYSRSKTGLHVIARGKIDGNISVKINKIHKKYSSLNPKSGIEIFTNHAITLTGNTYNDNQPEQIKNISLDFKNLYNFLTELKKRNLQKMQRYNNSGDLFNYIKTQVTLKQIFAYYGIQYDDRKNISCPIPGHKDKKPSFKISGTQDLFYCFAGCGGGTVIDFVMKMENLNSLDAAKWIQDKFNLEVEDITCKIQSIDLQKLREKLNNSNQSYTGNNLDLKPVKWHPDYTFVKYKFESKIKSMRLSEFLDIPIEERPEIEKFTVLNVEENITALLNHYNLEIKYNVIKMEYEVFKNGEYIDVLEREYPNIKNLCEKQAVKVTKDVLTDNLTYIAHKNKYNPWEDYLKEAHKHYLKNPDKDIFNEFADTLISDDKFKNNFIKKFLLQMIYVGCSPEESSIASDYILVLLGPQFIGKTTWLQNLLPLALQDKYFLSGRSLDLNNKDSVMETVSNILVEMGEIASTFKKSDQEQVKNFITSVRDKFRIPYAKTAIVQKRRVCLAATTNDKEFLRDLTGTRRYLTINCIDFKKNNNIDIDMLWGYMYSLYLENVSYKFTSKEVKEIMSYNEQYLNKPEKLLIIEDVWNLDPPENKGVWRTSAEIFNDLSKTQLLINKFTLPKELKKTKIKFKKDHYLNKDVFFVCRQNSISDEESDLPYEP